MTYRFAFLLSSERYTPVNSRLRIALALVLTLLSTSPLFAVEKDAFRSLFDGESLEGWVQRGGEAKYKVEDGAIVGTSVKGTPNSFLCTKRDYADFILEVELKVDNELNSGIQIRSHMHDKETKYKEKKIPAGRVHGYQVEIDPSDRSFSGGIYDEARRGWLYDLKGDKHQAARAAFRRDAWNKYRIEARGNNIKTWINGVPVADLTDDVDDSGFIALQVHSVADELAGKQVRWRNIRIRELEAASGRKP